MIMTTLTVRRKKERMNAHLSYKVLVNDVNVAEINAGEEKTVNCNSGDRIRFVMTWSGSKEIVIPDDEEKLTIICGGNLTYNVIGNAGGVLLFVLIIASHFIDGDEVGKKFGLGAALSVMLLLLYMLTIGKSNWIKIEV